MAAGIAELVLLELGAEAEVRSAGTLGIVGVPAHPHVIAVSREIGIDLSGHRSAALTAELVRWSDRIYVMEDAHGIAIRELVPDVGEIVIHLGPLAGQPFIADPVASWFRGPFRATRDQLFTAVRRALGA